MIIETDSAPPTMTGVSGLIDVHSHFSAKAHHEALERAGGNGLPVWNAERTLDVMGDVGIDYAVLSPFSPPPVFADVDDARRAAREFNEELADQIADDPSTYGGVALLPLPHVDAALEELTYALDVLKFEGAHMFAQYGGLLPVDARFEPLLHELNQRGVTVVTHPTSACATGQAAALETAGLAADLHGGGALERHPDIRWILAHCGGALPPARGLYVDVVCAGAEPLFSGLVERHGARRLVLGTGMPVEPVATVARGITALLANGAVDRSVKQAVVRDNALTLFPSVARKLRSGATG